MTGRERGPPIQDDELTADALDRRAALAAAAGMGLPTPQRTLAFATAAYQWLRLRDTLRPHSVTIAAGTPGQEGPPMGTIIDQDTEQVPLSLTGVDAKGAQTGSVPDGTTATWSLSDPDGSGAVLTPSADGLSAVLAPGQPDANVMVSVTAQVPNPDGTTTTFQAAEAFTITAGDTVGIGIVAGTPVPEQ